MNKIIIQTHVLGPLENNTYLIADPDTHQAVIVDPSLGNEILLSEIQRQGWTITQIWLTHAHFDHTSGISSLRRVYDAEIPIGLHPDDYPLYQDGGGAKEFGIHHLPGPEPSIWFEHNQLLKIGQHTIEIRHVPGHTPGHVLFYMAEVGVALCGDVIFAGSVGRTDLQGGSHARLMTSIREQILTMPASTRLLCGHGPETTVGNELLTNPFLGDYA